MQQGQFVRLPERGVVGVGGAEARPFLQGLISNDIDRLRPDRALYAALLTPQGKYLFDFLLVQSGDTIWLDAEAARRTELLERLTMYRLRAKVTLADLTETMEVLALAEDGPDLGNELGAATAWAGGVVFRDPRLARLGARAVLPRAAVVDAVRRIGLAEAEHTDYESLRLALGVPCPPHDLVPQRSLLLESSFEELDGVAFDKGCYVGQELTARTKHRALVRKRLLPVRVEGPLPAPGTPLMLGEREAGEMRSGEGGRGIALIRLEAIGESMPTLTAGESRATPEWPEWLAAREASPAKTG
jgi:folate-binding protein YgfZ